MVIIVQFYRFYFAGLSCLDGLKLPTSISRLVPGLGTTYDGVGGMGWDVNIHVNLQKQFTHTRGGVGGDGVGC